jgi:hypothetical protein
MNELGSSTATVHVADLRHKLIAGSLTLASVLAIIPLAGTGALAGAASSAAGAAFSLQRYSQASAAARGTARIDGMGGRVSQHLSHIISGTYINRVTASDGSGSHGWDGGRTILCVVSHAYPHPITQVA